MLSWTFPFIVIAPIAGVLGSGVVAGTDIIIVLLVIAIVTLSYDAYARRSRTKNAADSIRDAARSVEDVVAPAPPPKNSATKSRTPSTI